MARSRKQRRTKHSPAKWLLAGIPVAVILSFVLLFLLTQESTVSFQEAVDNPKAREEFIEEMLERHPPPQSVREVVYVEEENFGLPEDEAPILGPHSSMLSRGPKTTTDKLGQGYQMRVLVGPEAFSGRHIQNEADWAGALLHEYAHAELFGRGGFQAQTLGFLSIHERFSHVVNDELFVQLAELNAIRRELQQANPKQNSASYIDNRKRAYFEHYVELWKMGSRLNDNSFLSDLKVEYFPLEILPVTLADLERRRAVEIKSTLGERFALTPQEIEMLRERLERRG